MIVNILVFTYNHGHGREDGQLQFDKCQILFDTCKIVV